MVGQSVSLTNVNSDDEGSHGVINHSNYVNSDDNVDNTTTQTDNHSFKFKVRRRRKYREEDNDWSDIDQQKQYRRRRNMKSSEQKEKEEVKSGEEEEEEEKVSRLRNESSSTEEETKYYSTNSVAMSGGQFKNSFNTIEEVLSAELNTVERVNTTNDTEESGEESSQEETHKDKPKEDWEEIWNEISKMGTDELAVMAVQRSDEKETDKQREAKILMRKKFHVPKVDPPPPQDFHRDDRNIIEIIKDIVIKLCKQKVPPHLKTFYDSIVKYDTSQRLVTDNGMSLLREDVLKLMTKWKRLQEASKKEKEMMEEIERTVPLMIDRPEYNKNSGQYELGDEVEDLEDDEEIDVARKTREKKRSGNVQEEDHQMQQQQGQQIEPEGADRDEKTVQLVLSDNYFNISNVKNRNEKRSERSEEVFASLPYLRAELCHNKKRREMSFLLDSGAQCCLMSKKDLDKMGINEKYIRKAENIVLTTPSKHHKRVCYGKLKCQIAVQDEEGRERKIRVTMVVVNNEFNLNNKCILGSDFLQEISGAVHYQEDRRWLSGRDDEGSFQVMCQIGEEKPRQITKIEHSTKKKQVEEDQGQKKLGEVKEENNFEDDQWHKEDDEWEDEMPGLVSDEESGSEESDEESEEDEEYWTYERRVNLCATGNCRGCDWCGLESLEDCPHVFHIPACRHYEHENLIGKCQLEHRKDERCPCPREVRVKESVSGEVNQVKESRVFKKLPQKTSEDKMEVPEGHSITDVEFDKRNLMETLKPASKGKLDLKHLKDEKLVKEIREMEEEFTDLWKRDNNAIGKFKYFEAQFEIKPEGRNALIQKNRHVDWSRSKMARKKLAQLQETGVLEPVTENPLGIANFILVPKPMAGSHIRADKVKGRKLDRSEAEEVPMRIVTDFTTLNKYVESLVVTTLPNVDEVKSKISGHYCSKLDIADMYFNIRLAESCRPYVCVYGPEGQILQYGSLPQGLKSSAAYANLAMKATFSQEVLQEFKDKYGLGDQDLPFDSYDYYVIFYLDDVLIHTSTSDYEERSSQVHNNAIKSVLYALQRAGWKVSKEKTELRISDFIFLGQRFCPTRGLVGMSLERMESLINARVPLSCGEAASKLAAYSYSSQNAPMLRLISLPIAAMVHSGTFSWRREVSEAYSEMKVMALMDFSNHTFKPELHQFVFVDASKLAVSYIHSQLTEDGRLEMLDTKTKILTPGLMHSASVYRELEGLSYAFYSTEKSLQAAKGTFTILTDCQALVSIRRSKNYRSKIYELAVHMSQYEGTLELVYLPGRLNYLADQYSRQLTNVLLRSGKEDGYAKISEAAARIFPPCPEMEKNKILKLKGEDISRYLLGSQRKDWIDIFDDKKFVQTAYHSSDFLTLVKSQAAEVNLFNFLSGGWKNPESYSIDVLADLIKQVKTLSKQNFATVVKKLQLGGLKDHLEKIGAKTAGMTRLKSKYSEEERRKLRKYLFGDKAGADTEEESRIAVSKVQTRAERRNQDSKKEIKLPEKSKEVEEVDTSRKDQKMKEVRTCKEHHTEEERFKEELYWENEKEIKEFYDLLSKVEQKLRKEIGVQGDSDDKRGMCRNKECGYEKYHQFMETSGKVKRLLSEPTWTIKEIRRKKEKMKLHFISLYWKDSKEMEYRQVRDGLEIKASQDLVIEDWMGREFQIQLYLGADKDWTWTQHLKTDDYFVHVEESQSPGIYVTRMIIHNLSDERRIIKKGESLVSIKTMKDQDDQEEIVLIPVDRKIFQDYRASIYAAGVEAGRFRVEKLFKEYFKTPLLMNHLLLTTRAKKKSQRLDKKRNQKEEEQERNEKLEAFLICQRLQNNNGKLYKQDYINIQKGDTEIRKLFNKVEKKDSKLFKIRNGVLYKTTEFEGVEQLRVVITRAMYRLIASTFHETDGQHYQEGSLQRIMDTALYCKGAAEICHQIVSRCAVCQLSKPAVKKTQYGEKRSFQREIKPGEMWSLDVAYLPPGTYKNDPVKYHNLLVGVEEISGFVVGHPLRGVKTKEIVKIMKQKILPIFEMKYIRTDFGQEFASEEFGELLARRGIAHIGGNPTRKEGTGLVEVSIRNLKNALRVAITADSPGNEMRTNWPDLLDTTLRNLNNSIRQDLSLSKRQLLFSPLIYQKAPAVSGLLAEEEDLHKLHKKNILRILDVREAVLKRLRRKHGKTDFYPSQLVIQRKSNKSVQTTDGSREILPQTEVFRVIQREKDGHQLWVKSLLTGDEKKVFPANIELLENPAMDLMKINTEHLLDNVVSAHNLNRYRKAGRNLHSMKDPSEEVTSEEEEDEEGVVRQSDRLKAKRLAVNTVNTELKSILRVKRGEDPQKEKDWIYSQTESERRALQEAVKITMQSGTPLTEAQESFIKTNKAVKGSSCRFYFPKIPIDRKAKKNPHEGQKQVKSVKFEKGSKNEKGCVKNEGIIQLSTYTMRAQFYKIKYNVSSHCLRSLKVM